MAKGKTYEHKDFCKCNREFKTTSFTGNVLENNQSMITVTLGGETDDLSLKWGKKHDE